MVAHDVQEIVAEDSASLISAQHSTHGVPHLYAPAQTGMALDLCPLQETLQNRVQSRPLQLLKSGDIARLNKQLSFVYKLRLCLLTGVSLRRSQRRTY